MCWVHTQATSVPNQGAPPSCPVEHLNVNVCTFSPIHWATLGKDLKSRFHSWIDLSAQKCSGFRKSPSWMLLMLPVRQSLAYRLNWQSAVLVCETAGAFAHLTLTHFHMRLFFGFHLPCKKVSILINWKACNSTVPKSALPVDRHWRSLEEC